MERPSGMPPETRMIQLPDLEKVRGGTRSRYASRLADASGAERHELVITGPGKTIERALREAEIAIAVDPAADRQEWEQHLRPAWEEENRARDSFAAVESPPELFKKKAPSPPTAERSVFISLRSLEQEGTRYLLVISNFFVPRFTSFFFILPPVCSTFGILRPTSGDQDLFLHLGWPPAAAVRSSIRGGTTVDVVTFSVFCTFFTHFGPVHQVFGFASGVCGSFTFGGTDIFG